MYYLAEFENTFDVVKWLNKAKISPDRIVSVLLQQQPIPIVTVIYLEKDGDNHEG